MASMKKTGENLLGTMRNLLLFGLLISTFDVSAVAAVAAAADMRLDGGPSGWDQSMWYTQVDGVMGGKSSDELQFVDNGTAMDFSGDISLVGGGFSSVRRSFPSGELDLSPYAGVVVTLQADRIRSPPSAPLGIHLQFGDSVSRYGFSSAFAVPPAASDGTDVSVFLPMESFDRGTWIGYQCNDCALDVTAIDDMSVYVLFQEGPFAVRIKSIVAVTDARSFDMPSVDFESPAEVANLLRAAIESGGSLYDKSYPELCIAIYWSALNTIVEAEFTSTSVAVGTADGFKEVACAGLAESKRQGSKAERAWTLRHTMDAMLADIEGVDRPIRHDWLPAGNDVAESRAGECRGHTSMANVDFVEEESLTSVPSGGMTEEVPAEEKAAEDGMMIPSDEEMVDIQVGPSMSSPTSSGGVTLTKMDALRPGPRAIIATLAIFVFA